MKQRNVTSVLELLFYIAFVMLAGYPSLKDCLGLLLLVAIALHLRYITNYLEEGVLTTNAQNARKMFR